MVEAAFERMVERCRVQCGSDPSECAGDDEVISHYGDVDKQGNPQFHNNPRGGHPGLSVQRGDLTASEMCRLVRGGRATSQDYAASRVRQTTAGKLRRAGFAVIHTPTMIEASGHCSVLRVLDSGRTSDETPWPVDVTVAFDSCFNEA